MTLTPDDLAQIQAMISAEPTVGEGFPQPIVAGQNLLIAGIQSPNYVAGTSGWIINKNGAAQFNNITITGGGTITVSVQSTAPSGAHTGDLWFDTSNGNRLNQYNGSSWVAFQYGTNAIASGAITAALIAANTITASQIAANTITSAQIAAGTITAADLVAGIVVAGIVDATTITAATLIADGSSGQILVYSGTPATGNLVASVSAVSGTDAHSNAYQAGFAAYGTSQFYMYMNAAQLFLNAGSTTVAQGYIQGQNNSLSLASPTNSGTVSVAQLALTSAANPTVEAFGDLTYQGRDGTAYDTGRLTLITTGGLVSSTGAGTVAGMSWPVAIGTYHFHVKMLYVGTAASAGTPIFSWAAPATSSVQEMLSFSSVANPSVVIVGRATSLATGMTGPTLSTTVYEILEVDVTVTFTAAGTAKFQAACSVGADTYTIQSGSYVEVFPVI